MGRSWALVLALYGGAWAFLAWPWLSGAVTIPWDAKAHFYPQLQFLAQSIHRGEWPFWNPYVFSGSPQVADPQSLIFSPLFLLLAALDPDPSFQAFDAVVLGSLGLGGAFVLLLFRDRHWHPAGALVAALVFAFGASAAWRVQHVGQVMSLAAWPMALWLLARALDRGSKIYGLLAGFAAGSMALGRDQVAYLGLWLLAGYVVASWIQAADFAAVRRSLKPLVTGALGGALIVIVPIGLTLLLAGDSNRPAITYSEAARGAVHPALLMTAVIPNLFGADGPFLEYWGPPSPLWGETNLVLARNMGVIYLGALPLGLILVGLFKGVLWAREIRFFTIALVLMLLYALGGAMPVFRLAFELVPGIDFFRRPADATFLVGALGAIVAGYLVHRIWHDGLLREGPRLGLGETVLALAVFAIAIALALTKGRMPIAAWPIAKASLFVGAAVALIWILPALVVRWPRWALSLVLVFLVADLHWNNGPNESTALPSNTYDVLRPETRNETIAALTRRLGAGSLDRVELTGLGFHWPNASMVHRLHNVLGYNPLRLGLYTLATGAEDHVALPEQRRFSPLFPSYRSPLADLLGLRFIVSGVPIEELDRSLQSGDLKLLARTADGYIYENPRALPRAFFAGHAMQGDVDALLKTGRWPDMDVRNTVLLSGQPDDGLAGDGPAEPAAIDIVTYRNTDIVIDLTTSAPGYLVLNDPFHPWWGAEIDGRDVPILQANGLFRAVHVEQGTQRVRFVFRPFRGAWREARHRWPVLERLHVLVAGRP